MHQYCYTVKLGTIWKEVPFKRLKNERIGLATSNLCHHQDFTVRVQRKLEPYLQSFSTDITTQTTIKTSRFTCSHCFA